MKYIVNHSSAQAIFCVPQTLQSVSLMIALLVAWVCKGYYAHDFSVIKNILLVNSTFSATKKNSNFGSN